MAVMDEITEPMRLVCVKLMFFVVQGGPLFHFHDYGRRGNCYRKSNSRNDPMIRFFFFEAQSFWLDVSLVYI